MAPIKPAAGAPAPQTTPPATTKPAGKRTDLDRVLDKVTGALRELRRAHKYAVAWKEALAGDRTAGKGDHRPELGQISKIAAATEEQAINRLVEAEAVAQALLEARWKPPVVKLPNSGGAKPFAQDDHVTFSPKYLAWASERGVCTKAEVADMVVVRVVDAKGKVWVTAISSSSQNHFGPLPAHNFRHLPSAA